MIELVLIILTSFSVLISAGVFIINFIESEEYEGVDLLLFIIISTILAILWPIAIGIIIGKKLYHENN